MTGATASLYNYDVGHGDHLLLRIDAGDSSFHAVIDCYWPDRTPPPALQQLQAWGVRHLDLLILTHPHLDHFLGLAGIAEYFTSEGRTLGRYMDFGLDLRLVADRCYRSGHPAHLELYRLFGATIGRRLAGGSTPCYTPLTGPRQLGQVAPGTQLTILSPPRAAWNEEHLRLCSGEPLRPNRVCSVTLWQVVNAVLVLAADLEAPEWEQVLAEARRGGTDCRADVVKVPHHGGESANPGFLWSALAAEAPRETHAAISTRGTLRHPSTQTLQTLVRSGVSPRCTRFGPVCEAYVPWARRALAMSEIGLQPRAAPRDQALGRLGLQKIPDRSCFGTTRFQIAGSALVNVFPTVAHARCHYKAAHVPDQSAT